MCAERTDPMVATIKDAAAKLTGHPRRAFQAKVTLDYLGGSARRAETVVGWGREAVQRAYQTGVRLTKAALKPFAERVRRSKSLPGWSASIHPHPTRAVPLCSPP